ncbi:hypothetical protein KLP28_02685 [Nocardioidaceae bacterium]|nr:hypothetical protein KLP28_02685 [Nocardioidaceae bacterium]
MPGRPDPAGTSEGPAGGAAADAPWTWRYETADGHVTGHSETFDSQSDAETWLGTEFEDLLEHGVDKVTLLEGERVAYGMSLHES